MHALTEWWNRISLRTKITGVTVLLLTMGLLVAGVGTMTVLRNYLLEEVDKKIDSAVEALPDRTISFTGTDDDLHCTVLTLPTDFFLAIVQSDGELLCSNASNNAKQPVVTSLASPFMDEHEGTVKLTLPSSSLGGQWRVVANPVTANGTAGSYTAVIGLDLGASNATISRLAAIFLFFGLTVVIFGGALTRLLVTSTFTPLREVEATAARFAEGDFNQRIAGATPNTEVGRLNRSLNSMLGTIDSAFADRARTIDQMRRFVGDASHELRTPLVSVRGYAELYRMGALTTSEDVAQAMERIEKEAIRMGELVEDLLELARLDEAKPLQLTEVDLVPLARDAALDAMASAPDRVVTVVGIDIAAEPDLDLDDIDPPTRELILPDTESSTSSRSVPSLATGPIAFAGATLARLVARRSRAREDLGGVAPATEPPNVALRAVVLAEENKIRQVVANLIGNAMRFTPEGSPLEIGVGVDSARRRAMISVIDHGEGVPPQIRGRIFERFYRADSSRQRATGGSGLGLAIVAAIVEAHGGDVDIVETSGGGATFRISLPLLPSAVDAPALPVAPQE
ncbi:ATP-binding protein [Salinibacterium sp. G-O1]|uniref:sensor histidine kinase n=1 Tax=Salinibacterium sp. G-O1 TaxID=3046208 RepID=UPI0024BB569C|nr:HAMP domain-containing sensor histidine kinase [Salinibacterium sp. G-O1]MDJ0336068.1 ATP-binding protein [Salinibacterium sp. G-O1]